MIEIHEAFLKAQAEFPDIGKDSEAKGTKFSYKYASLPEILKSVLPVLHKNKLSLSQTFDDGGMLHTIITHAQHAQQLESVMPMPTALNMGPQDYGKVITYMRRYSLVAMLGLCPDDDVDAADVKQWRRPTDNIPQSSPNKFDPIAPTISDVAEESTRGLADQFDKSISLDTIKANIKTAIEIIGEEAYRQWHNRVLSNFYGVDSIESLNYEELQDFCEKQRVKISESKE